FALLALRHKAMLPFGIAAFVFFVFSFADATVLPFLFYNLIPAANRLRHIGLLLPICRLMIVFIAGLGFDRFIESLKPDRSAAAQIRILAGIIAGLMLIV